MTDTRNIQIDRDALLRNVLIFCVSVEFLLFTLDYHISMAGGIQAPAIRRLFNTAREDSLPGWIAIMQTGLVALTVWAVWALVRQHGNKWQRRGWFAIALFFSYLTLDDGAHIHERVGTWFDEAGGASAMGAWMLDQFPSYRWQLVFMPAFVCMGLFIFGFMLWELRGWKPKATVLLALGCLALAVGLDFFEGLTPDHALNPYTALAGYWQLDYWTARTFGENPYETLLHFSKSFEECIEMFGMTLLLLVFLDHLLLRVHAIRFNVRGGMAATQTAPDVHRRPGNAEAELETPLAA